MASENPEEISQRQIFDLARALTVDNMESIGEGYLGIKHVTLQNLKTDTKSAESFNRTVLRYWKNRNAGKNDAQVSSQISRTQLSNELNRVHCIKMKRIQSNSVFLVKQYL